MPPRSTPTRPATSRTEPVITVAEVADVLLAAGSLALACHHHPDGDALGSMLAMHLLCEANGKKSVASWPSPWVVGPHYEFLPGLDRCIPPEQFPTDPEVLVTFDLKTHIFEKSGCVQRLDCRRRSLCIERPRNGVRVLLPRRPPTACPRLVPRIDRRVRLRGGVSP